MMSPRTFAGLLLLCLLIAAAPGCISRQRATTPSLASDLGRLQSDLDLLPPHPRPANQTGSLWNDGGPGAALVRDHRAYRVNDLLTVVVQESSSGTNASSTDLSRSSDSNFAAPFVFGADELDEVLTTGSESQHSGDGTTARSSLLASTLTARVMRALPNGTLMIAGQKTVMINREKQVLTLVGTVRPADVLASNRVSSASIGDLTVRLWGAGEVDDTIRQGWFMRIMNRIWPF